MRSAHRSGRPWPATRTPALGRQCAAVLQVPSWWSPKGALQAQGCRGRSRGPAALEEGRVPGTLPPGDAPAFLADGGARDRRRRGNRTAWASSRHDVPTPDVPTPGRRGGGVSAAALSAWGRAGPATLTKRPGAWPPCAPGPQRLVTWRSGRVHVRHVRTRVWARMPVAQRCQPRPCHRRSQVRVCGATHLAWKQEPRLSARSLSLGRRQVPSGTS